MPYVDLDGLRMYYAEHGRLDGPPLVLLHAFMATGEQWRRQIDAFGARYRLIVPDLRGHGRDRKSTRLNSSHEWRSYAVFCLKKKSAHGA